MKLGLIARADNSGLGVQTHEFYKNMAPAKTMVVDISKMNGNKIYPERYPDGIFIRGIPTENDIRSFLQGLDVVFIAESAYNPAFYNIAREMGVKTAVQYNYEFLDWIINPDYPRPDMLIAPSKWHYIDVERWCGVYNVQHVYLHCPVNQELLKPKLIDEARTFLHVAGRSAAHDRNGTLTVIGASKYLESDANIIIHFQGEQGLAHQATNSITDYMIYADNHGNADKLIFQQIDFDNYAEVYEQGDVLLLPRRYGGNCLPMNEALAIGMPVIATNIEPNNKFLPAHWLIDATVKGSFTPRTHIEIYEARPDTLAQKIDWFYGLGSIDMSVENAKAKELGDSIGWQVMKKKYEEVLGGLCQ